MQFDLSTLTYIDYIGFSIILLSMLIGFYKGFLSSFLAFFAWVVAILLTLIFQPDLFAMIHKHVQNKFLLYTCSYFGSFIAFLFAISLINSFILKFLTGVKGGLIDLSLGAAFGVVRGCIISCVIFFIAICLSHSVSVKPHALMQAQSYRLLKIGTNTILDLVIKYSGHEGTEKFLIEAQEKMLKPDSEDKDLKELIINKTDEFISSPQGNDINIHNDKSDIIVDELD
jgi:membrane protein required for colicin V production